MNTVDSRQVAVGKYFLEDPEKPSYALNVISLVIGALIALYGLLISPNSGLLLLVGVAVLLVTAVVMFSKNGNYQKALSKTQPKPSDTQMDEWLAQDKKRIVDEALDKLNLVPEQVLNIKDPLLVIGPQSNSKVKVGDDNTVRFSAYQLVVIYLSNYHLGAYSCNLNFIDGRTGSEETQEFHYTDVVSVSTQNSNSSFVAVMTDGKEHPISAQQQFSLSVSSGESIRVTVAFPQADGIFKEKKLLPTGSEKAISTLRTMLREKKGGLLPSTLNPR